MDIYTHIYIYIYVIFCYFWECGVVPEFLGPEILSFFPAGSCSECFCKGGSVFIC